MTEKGVEIMNELIRAIEMNCKNDLDPYCYDCPLWVKNKCLLIAAEVKE